MSGWQCVWQHARSGDVFTGEVWPDRATAEEVAVSLRESGYCLRVHVRRVYVPRVPNGSQMGR